MANGYYDNPPGKRYGGAGFKKKDSRRIKRIVLLICVLAAGFIVFKAAFGSGGDTRQASVNQPGEQEVVRKKEFNIPPASEENDLMKIVREAEGSDNKICYLTFDDGPTREVTPKVLDVLKQYNVPATFFCLGKMLDANRDIAEREFKEGHLLANHSYNHDYKALYATSDSFMEEIEKTERIIQDISGEDTLKLIRFPGGGYNAGDHAAEKQVYKKVLREHGYYYADWNCLNGDAEASLRDVNSLLAKVKTTAVEDNIVVLMHDAAVKTTTPQALGQIIEYLRGKGYEFRRLDEVDYYDNGKVSRDGNSSIIL